MISPPVTITGGPAAPAAALNESSVPGAITGKSLFSQATALYLTTLTVTNNSGQSISGPISTGILNLSPGVALANATGTINGSPYIAVSNSGLNAGESASVTITSTSSPGSFGQATYAGAFPPSPLTVTCPANTGSLLASHNLTVQSTGGITACVFSVIQGSLPAGLTPTTATGFIPGTPPQARNHSFSIRVTGSAQIGGQTASAARSIAIAP